MVKKGFHVGRHVWGNRTNGIAEAIKMIDAKGMDTWFSMLLQASGHFGRLQAGIHPVASECVAARFSVETRWSADHAADYTPVGVHKAYRYLQSTVLSRLIARCPPLERLVNATRQDADADQKMSQVDRTMLAVPAAHARLHRQRMESQQTSRLPAVARFVGDVRIRLPEADFSGVDWENLTS